MKIRSLATLKRLLKKSELWLAFAGVVGLIYGGVLWIRKSAQDAVLDEKFQATLAAKIRPSCIFDSNGSIEADFGASEYIDDISVTAQPKSYGYSITVKCKRHLAYPPLISGIDVALLSQSTTRGKMHDWTVVVAPNGGVPAILYDESYGSNTNMGLHRFRLEILH